MYSFIYNAYMCVCVCVYIYLYIFIHMTLFSEESDERKPAPTRLQKPPSEQFPVRVRP